MTRALFTGSRHWSDWRRIGEVIARLPIDAVVIVGGARGADEIAEVIACAMGLRVEVYRADWTRHGNTAGPIRNQRMIDEGHPTEAHAFPLPGSRGTLDMIARCKAAKVHGVVHRARDAA